MATEVPDPLRDTQPYFDIGIIFVTFPDGLRVQGTCSLVGRNDILTATHVVYSPDNGGWAEDFEFYFGADFNNINNSFEDFGYQYSPGQWTVNGWPDQSFTDSNNETMLQSETQYDVAIIGVDDSIGDTLGWLGLDSGYNAGGSANAVGYPGDSSGMMHETVLVSENPNYWMYESDYDVMGPGSSGGPLLVNNNVIGVKSTGSWWADIGFSYDTLLDIIDENDSLLTNINDLILNGTDVDDTLMGGEGDDVLYGWAGNDILYGGVGNDTLDGGDGIDIARYDGSRFDYTIDHNSIRGNHDGTDALLDIERLQFDTTSLALDLDGNAGMTAKLLGAAFGADAVENREYVGIGLSLLDSGWSYEDLADLAMAASGASSSDSIVTTLWQNLVGTAPTEADKAPFVAMLDNGEMTQGELTIFAADLDINLTNINLVGLMDTGLEYYPSA